MNLGSEIRDPEKKLFRIPDPGVKKTPDPGSATLLENMLKAEQIRKRVKSGVDFIWRKRGGALQLQR
jgi:hypothetical protein